jgi:hypothetical protein
VLEGICEIGRYGKFNIIDDDVFCGGRIPRTYERALKDGSSSKLE